MRRTVFAVLAIAGIGLWACETPAEPTFEAPDAPLTKAEGKAIGKAVASVTGAGHIRLSIKFYLTAILFVVFDIEAVFLYPWASLFRELGWLGFVEMVLFIVVLGVTLIYAWRKGALEWES